MVLIQYPIDYYNKPGNQNFELLTFFYDFHVVSEKPRRKKIVKQIFDKGLVSGMC